jgi:hypothetical protein
MRCGSYRPVDSRIKWMTPLLALGIIAATTTGCANRATAMVDPSARLDAMKTFHVVKHDKDTRDVNTVIADSLRGRGYTVTTSEEKPTTGVDAIVTYVDRWMWDITMYMIQLTVQVREPKTEYPLATGNSLHGSLTRLSPPEMADEVLGNIFKQSNKEK